MCPTVYAIAAPTPMGAKYITSLVNLNITSARPSQNTSTGWRLDSGTRANAIPAMRNMSNAAVVFIIHYPLQSTLRNGGGSPYSMGGLPSLPKTRAKRS